MKKKALALICAATMVLGMSMTVFAAPSPSTEGSVGVISTGTQTLSDGTIADFAQVTSVAGGTVTAVNGDVAAEAVSEANKLFGSGSFIATVVDINVPNATFPYTLTINNPNVWAGQTVTVLHKVNGSWERLTPSNVSDNAVTVTVNSFSPFAVAINTSTSPETQDIALPVSALAGVFAAGVVIIGRKRVQR